MNKTPFLIAAGVGIMLLLGILASQVGGIAIRRTATQADEVQLTLPTSVLPGVETAVRFTAPAGLPNSEVSLRVRSSSGESVIGEGRLGTGVITAVFPCDLAGREISVILWDMRTSQLLASRTVQLLAAGPDCF